MPLPIELDSHIRQQFEHLETQAKILAERNLSLLIAPEDVRSKYVSDYYKARTSFISLIQMLATKRTSYSDLIKDIRTTSEHYPEQLYGMILGLKSAYENGMLKNLSELIETNVIADYLIQAEQLLNGNKKGIHTYGPAAVLAGTVLEDSLRRLCNRQEPPISTTKTGGHPKSMGILIDDLKNANLFNELKAKQLRAWADIRNAAAHGRFDEFNREDVEQMILGIQTFLANYL